jgi:NAD(P)-dependent dehydrogenase (short-subunit alcohol dehydrogenase family)
MPRLAGQVAIVTGGGKGIGGATARRLAEDGASVLIADIDGDAAERNLGTIRAAGGDVEMIVSDVGKHDDIRAMVDTAVQRWGKLNILVNNAYRGQGMKGSAVEVEEDAWDRGLAILIKALYLGAKYAVPEMQKAGGGAIVNLSSVHGLLMAANSLIYEAGKSAVIGITRQMAVDFGPSGIRVNAICPGHIVTERISPQWEANPSGLRFFEEHYPLRRTGVPADIANAIAFLCSADASFITGHALVVDGGMTIQLQENLAVQVAHYLKENPDPWLPY